MNFRFVVLIASVMSLVACGPGGTGNMDGGKGGGGTAGGKGGGGGGGSGGGSGGGAGGGTAGGAGGGTAGGAGGGTAGGAGGAGGGAPLAGDTCLNTAAAITASGTLSGQTNVGYTNDYGSGTNCSGTVGLDHVYEVIVPAGQVLTATVHSTTVGFDPSINLVAAPASSCATTPRVCIASDDSGSATTDNVVTITNASAAAVSYFVVIDSFSTTLTGCSASVTCGAGTYDLTVTLATPPAGDSCSTATALTAGTPLTAQTTVGYSNNYSASGTNCSSSSAGPDRTYSISVPAGQRLTVTVTPVATFDTSVTLVQGTAASCEATPRVCAANNNSGGSGAADVVTYTNLSGQPQTLFAIVDSSSTTGNTFTILGALDIPPAGPANDTCAGAIAISPAALPITTTAVDITNASVLSEIPPATPALTQAATCQSNTGYSIWYSFTPTANGNYTFETCSPATTTTVGDTVLQVYTTTGGCAGPFTQIAGGCNDDGCGNRSIVSLALTSGTTYYIQAMKYDNTAAPAVGANSIQVRVNQILAPTNDTCGAATAMTLNTPINGTNAGAANDYQIAAACFAGLGNTTSTAPGRDVVYSFNPPSTGLFSFRARSATSSENFTMYLSDTCSTGAAPISVATCKNAVDRNSNTAEEIACVSLTSGTPVFAYVDAQTNATGNAYEIEVNACTLEVEPNSTPAAGGPRSCPVTGAINATGDLDYYSLGTPAAGARVFAIVDGIAVNSTDLDIRITTATDTLQYSDTNNDVQFGGISGSVAGTPLTAVPSYVQVSHFSGSVSEPYRMYSVVQPPIASATLEVEPNETTAAASTSAINYFSGALSGASPSTDVDVYSFNATVGDTIYVALDGDPLRNNTPFNAQVELLNSAGTVLMTVNDGASSSSTTASTTLTGSSPTSPNDSLVFRARATGVHYVRVTAGSTSTTTAAGDYLLSVSKNCVAGP